MLSIIRRTWKVALATGTILALLVIYGVIRNSTTSIEASDKQNSLNQKFDAGTKYSGDIIEHTFDFTNNTTYDLKINSDSDIKKSCGCTTTSLEKTTLLSGQSIPITVKINTSGKEGYQSQNALFRWQATSGEVIESKFTITAKILPVLSFEPELLTFSEEEIKNNVTKKVRIYSPLMVDWSTANVSSSSNFAITTICEKLEDAIYVNVQFRIPNDVANVSAYLNVSVLARSSDINSKPSRIQANSRLSARHQANIIFQPRMLLFAKASEAGKLRSKVWLSGKLLSEDNDPIESIRIGNSKVSYQVDKSANNSFMIELNVSENELNDLSAISHEITIGLKGLPSITVPFVWRR